MIDIKIDCPTGDPAKATIRLKDGTPVLGVSKVELKIEPRQPVTAKLDFCLVGLASHAKADLIYLAMRIYELSAKAEREEIEEQIRQVKALDA